MATSLIYRNALIYETVMVALYGRHYAARYRALTDLIPDGASVLDLCCGPALLYTRYLRHKGVQYTGLDINERFIRRLNRLGGRGRVADLRRDDPLPEADHVLMQASLYHFLPDAHPVVDRMLAAARRQVIIAEPVRNLAASPNRLLALAGRWLTDPGVGRQSHRFNPETLAAFFARYGPRVARSFPVANGREIVYVLSRDQ